MVKRFDWRRKAIADIDGALTAYVEHRDQLNQDGQAKARATVIDECLDRRNKLTAEIAANQ